MTIITLKEVGCHTRSDKRLFGLCDDPPPAENPAYIDEDNGGRWIAVVENDERYDVTFTAIDRCIETRRADGKMDVRCDGALSYNTTVIFVELKERGGKGNIWIVEAEEQLRTSIGYFERQVGADDFHSKKAYIANSQRPKFKESQTRRMRQFQDDTGYVLRIESRIILT